MSAARPKEPANDEPAEELEPRGVKQAGHGHQASNDPIRSMAVRQASCGAQPAAAIEGARLIQQRFSPPQTEDEDDGAGAGVTVQGSAAMGARASAGTPLQAKEGWMESLLVTPPSKKLSIFLHIY